MSLVCKHEWVYSVWILVFSIITTYGVTVVASLHYLELKTTLLFVLESFWASTKAGKGIKDISKWNNYICDLMWALSKQRSYHLLTLRSRASFSVLSICCFELEVKGYESPMGNIKCVNSHALLAVTFC